MKWSVISFMLVSFTQIVFGQTSNEFVLRKSAGNYHLTVTSKIGYYGPGLAQVDYFAGHYADNAYQKVLSKTKDEHLEVKTFGASDLCVQYSGILGKDSDHGKKLKFTEEYELEVFDVAVNWDLIDSIYPYDKDAGLYQEYTKPNKPFIDLGNPELRRFSDSIWKSSENILDYAERCYEFVARHFSYGDPLTGFHPLSTIMENGGGDCGNLCSIWISLLRMKGIPARHIVGNRPDESLHVWAEFYLQNYGWIPVDVTYKQSDPEGNYFGDIKFENNGFVIHRGIGQTVTKQKGIARVASLQTYSYEAEYTKESTSEVVVSRKITAVRE